MLVAQAQRFDRQFTMLMFLVDGKINDFNFNGRFYMAL